uniref:Bee-milk protein n=1 Tax=Timema cristinae TaxID=61476 RepID=A0A7R9D2V1_TIMCR|nr:unnamed protein product [Timema cristinae]
MPWLIKRILRVITTQHNDADQVPTRLVEDAYKISKEVGLDLTVSNLWLQLSSVRPFRREGNCSCIQSVAALDIDPIGRLWVLDEGGRCPPKLVVLDLWRNREVTRCELPSIEGREMRSLAVDTLSGWGARAYIGDPAGNRLMIFSIRDQRYWFARLQLRRHMEYSLVSHCSMSIFLSSFQLLELLIPDIKGF